MKEFKYTITDSQGNSCQTGGSSCQKKPKFASDIKIEKAGKAADAKRIFGVMGLAAKQGEEVVIRVEGADEAEAAGGMEAFLKKIYKKYLEKQRL